MINNTPRQRCVSRNETIQRLRKKTGKLRDERSTFEAVAAVCGGMGRFCLHMKIRISVLCYPACRLFPAFVNRGFPTTATPPPPHSLGCLDATHNGCAAVPVQFCIIVMRNSNSSDRENTCTRLAVMTACMIGHDRSWPSPSQVMVGHARGHDRPCTPSFTRPRYAVTNVVMAVPMTCHVRGHDRVQPVMTDSN